MCGIQYFYSKISCDYPLNMPSYHLGRGSGHSSVNMRGERGGPRPPYITHRVGSVNDRLPAFRHWPDPLHEWPAGHKYYKA